MPNNDMKRYYQMLAQILADGAKHTSADVIDAFATRFPDEWKALVAKYGDREEKPGEGARGHFYAASTWIADRLVHMSRKGWVELTYTTEFDQERWKHNKRMGVWRLLSSPAETRADDSPRRITVPLTDATYKRLEKDATDRNRSVGARAAELIAAGLESSLLGNAGDRA
jgi:hypothetical protein